MGAIFSNLHFWKRGRARRARNKNARDARRYSTSKDSLLGNTEEHALLIHNKSMTEMLKKCQEINRDVLQNPETRKTEKNKNNLNGDLEVCNESMGRHNSEAKVEDIRIAPPTASLPPPPPPPPPPPGSGFVKSKEELPHGLKHKEKLNLPKKLTQPRWKSLDVHSLPASAIWVLLDKKDMSAHQGYLVEKLTNKFTQSCTPRLSVREPSIIMMDNQLCLNLKLFQKTTKTQDSKVIVSQILQCNSQFLTSEVLKLLKNLLPKENGNNFLDEPSDSFLSPILAIDRLSERIDVLLFRVENNKSISEHHSRFMKEIDLVRKACCELKRSESLPILLSLLLFAGNVMKSSSGNQQSYGFDVSFLSKLKDTRQGNSQLSLLDFLVETVSEKFPLCLNFPKEIPSIDEASNVSIVKMNSWLSQINDGLTTVETEIGFVNFPKDGDKLKDVLTPFAKKSRKVTAELEEAISNMQTDFDNIKTYFVYTHENKDTEPCVEFFGFFRTFQEQFQEAVKKLRM